MCATIHQNTDPPDKNIGVVDQTRRTVYLMVGCVCVALGAAGLFLPVLPGTPLLIVALWAFSRSSKRFHDWLFNHRYLGPPVRAWQRDRVIPFRVKCIAFSAMIGSFGYLAFGRETPWPVLAVIGAVMAFGMIYIARCPSRVENR